MVCQFFDTAVENAKIYEILHILLFDEEEKPYVLCRVVNLKKYHKHYAAFEVDRNYSNNSAIIIIAIGDLLNSPVNFHTTIKGLYMIRPQQYHI